VGKEVLLMGNITKGVNIKRFCTFSLIKRGERHPVGVPCEDATSRYEDDKVKIAVVADGISDPYCFRSECGSKLAVEVSIRCIRAFIEQMPASPVDISGQEGKVMFDNLCQQFLDQWFIAVDKHVEANPLEGDPALDRMDKYDKASYLERPTKVHSGYATTLIVVAITEHYWFGFQIGDGRCVALYEDGKLDFPVPKDNNCLGHSTTNIAYRDSIDDFRFFFCFPNSDGKFTEYSWGPKFQDKTGLIKKVRRPIALFVATDGVDDSLPWHRKKEHLTNFYRYQAINFAENGFDNAVKELDDIAVKFSTSESKDDVSIAGIVGDLQRKKKLMEKIKKEAEAFEKYKESDEFKRYFPDE